MNLLSSNTKAWLHGLFAASISAFATAASGILTLPTVFNFSHDGIINMVKVAGVPAMLSAFAYLKQSPLPPSTALQAGDTATVKDAVITSDSISGSSATILKAPTTTTTAPPVVPKP
jgi:hypothetical protein